ncbi:hypothetical protein J6590_022345, partial [Homalodisca vitripennis]
GAPIDESSYRPNIRINFWRVFSLRPSAAHKVSCIPRLREFIGRKICLSFSVYNRVHPAQRTDALSRMGKGRWSDVVELSKKT